MAFKLKRLALVALVALAGCKGAPRVPDGTPVRVNAPQSAEQCKAQPWLDWCKDGR